MDYSAAVEIARDLVLAWLDMVDVEAGEPVPSADDLTEQVVRLAHHLQAGATHQPS